MNQLNQIAIETVDLSKTYVSGKVETKVLNNIDLTIEKGEFVSIMGPSGSGKSTLLYLLGGLENPTDGQVYIEGVDINALKDREISDIRSRKIGFVFQFYNLVAHLNVVDNILLPALLSGGKKRELMARMDALLETVGLMDKKKAYPSELSGGQQQRVAIARALIQQPDIVLADEPIGNLDSKTGEDIMALFKCLNQEKGITIVQVTHSYESAQYGSTIIHLKDGVIIDEETVKSLQIS